MNKMLLAASATVLMLTGCFGTNNNTTGSSLPNMPNVTASASPSAAPSAAPSTTPTTPTTPSTPATTTPSSTPSSTSPTAPAASGKLVVTNQDIFNKYNVEYRVGRKWVYTMKMPALDLSGISIPGFGTLQFGNITIPGVSIPGIGGSGSGSASGGMDLGEFSMEVVKVDGNMVTVRSAVNLSSSLPSGGAPMQPQEQTFPISEKSKLFSEMTQSAGTEGTLDWNRNVSAESISVAAGNYNADKITGVMNVKSTQEGATATIKQDITTWIADGVGMVKQETKSSSAVSGGGASGTVSTGVVLELKSFISG